MSREVDDKEHALRALLDDLTAELPRPLLRERVMRAALGVDRFPADLRARLQALFELDAAQTVDLVGRMNDAASWQAGPVPGLSLFAATPMEMPAGPLPDGPTRLIVRLEPGLPFPMHAHHGDEHMLVLEGGFVTDDGKRVGAGEMLSSTRDSEHAFLVDEDDECIAAVKLTDGIHLVASAR